MRRALVLLVLAVLACAARAQTPQADEEFLLKAYPALRELEWLLTQRGDRTDAVAQKAELVVTALGPKSLTDANNYRQRRLFVLRVNANRKLAQALLLAPEDLQPVVAELKPAPTNAAFAQIDELLDSLALKSSKQVTGGSIRAPPPPPTPVPHHEDTEMHVAMPGAAMLGGIGAALALGLVAIVMMTRPKPAGDLSAEAGEVSGDAVRARRPVGPAAKPGSGATVLKGAGRTSGANLPAAPAAPAVPAGGKFRAVIETSGDANPMGRTQSIVFEPTNVFLPGQAPEGAGKGIAKPAAQPPPAAGPAAAAPAAPAGKGGETIVAPPTAAAAAPAAAPAKRPAPAPRQPEEDSLFGASKMNRTLPPYQPRGISIRRPPKPPPPANQGPPQVPPDTLPDRYVVTSILGKGGMGVVYKAFDGVTKKEVAVKTLGADVMSTDTARERFVREYETLNALDHPNIIKVYDMGCITTPYFAMEFANGDDLGTIMLDQDLPAEAVLEIGIQLANALEYAHSEGVYHRDIKPSNLMITGEGLLKIVDFGLVKDTHASSLTMDGTVLGSLRFMAPEQLAAEPVDARSDVYAMGMTLYYLLSGSTPFDGQNPVVKLSQEPASVLLRAPQADKRLAFAIDRCIRKKAEDRWQTAREVEDALRAIAL